MLRVLTLSTLFPDASRPAFGGFVERQTTALVDGQNIAVEVVAPIGRPLWPLNQHPRYQAREAIPYQEEWKGLTVHRPRFPLVPLIGGRFAPSLLARAAMPVLQDIRSRFPFDIIDAEFFYPDGPAAMRLAAALNVPFTITARGSDIHYWGKYKSSAGQMRMAAERASGLLAVSAALRQDMIDLGLPGEKIAVHYTGVDQEKFAPGDRVAAKAELGIGGPLVVCVGALIPLKNQGLLIDAIRDIPGAHLWLAGEGPDRRSLQKKIAAHGLDDRVRLLGNLPHDEMPGLLAAADVMALPSTMEGLPNAWIEALSCGAPIIITDVGGAREIIDRPEAGAIVASDARAIAAAIRAILADPPDQMAVRATIANFLWSSNSKEMAEYLSRLVNGQV